MYKTGGEIEKGGNQYESLALIYYFTKLLNDEVVYIQSESFDEEIEKGTDIIIKDKNDNIFVVQAKSRDGIDDSWDLNKFKKLSIIKNACKHILDGRDFHLLSTLGFTAMQDWCNQAQGFDDFQSFEKFIVGKSVKSPNVNLFEEFVAEIKSCFGSVSPLKFFQHFHVDYLPDDRHFIIDCLASFGRVNEPNEAFALLDHYVTKYNKLNQKIYVSEIKNFLKNKGITFYNIDNQAASETLSDLQEKFIKNLEGKLITQKWIERIEFEKLLDILDIQKIAIISGQSGTGKSALIYKLCKHLKSENKIFLPISFEVNKPSNNLYQYGKSLGFTASPTDILKQLSDDKECYLIIDQVDAINWDQTDWNSAFEACCSLVEACNLIPKLKIIFACRTIDADKILKFWRTSAPKLSDCQICLSTLDSNAVNSVIPPDKLQNLTQGVRKLLHNARNLKMYTELCTIKDYVPSNNIIHDYILIKQDEVQKKGFNSDEIIELRKNLIGELKRNHTTTIPLYNIDERFNNNLIHAFCSAGIIEITSNNLLKFTHQSILDYYLVKDLISALDNGQSITHIIKQFNSHPLSNYEIIKQFIEACYDREQYVNYLGQIIFCNKIRMIIKNIAIKALRTIKSDNESNELFIKIIRSKHYGFKYLYFLCNGNRAFSSYFIKQKEFTTLLKSSNYEDNLQAIDLLLEVKDPYSIKILKDYINNTTDKRLLRRLIDNIDDLSAPDELFDLKISLLRKNIYKHYFIDWTKLLTAKSERIAQYLFLFLSDDCIDRNCINKISSDPKIIDAVKSNYQSFYKLCKKKIEAEFDFELIFDSISQYDDNKKLLAFIFETSVTFLSKEEIITLAYSEKAFFKHTALRAINICDFSKGLDVFTSLIIDKFIAQQNYFHDRKLLEIVCALLTKFSDSLSADIFRNSENQINSYKSPSLIEFAKERFEQRKCGQFYHYSEEEQRRFLECLPYDKLTEFSKNYLSYLKRKFPQKCYFTWTPEMDQVTSYTVVSCIAEKWKSFSPVTWHQIMSNPKTGQRNRVEIVKNNQGQAIEATLLEFCSTIDTAAHAKPKTFVDLALKYDDLRLPFVEAICEGLCINNEDDTAVYEQCPPDQKLLVYKKYFDITNKKIMRSFVRFIEYHDITDPWIFAKLLEIANNPDKYEHDVMNIWSSNWDHKLETLTAHDIDTEKLNRVQTCAVNCIAYTLSVTQKLDENIKSILSKCMDSPHPAILFSAIDILYSICNFDKDFAVTNLLIVYQKDIRSLASIKSIKILQCSIKDYHDKFYNIFEKAIQTNNAEFEYVYRIIISSYCLYGYYHDLVKILARNCETLCLQICAQMLIKHDKNDILERTRNLILAIQVNSKKEGDEAFHSNPIINCNLMSNPKNQNIILKTIKSKCFFGTAFPEFQFLYELQQIPSLLPVSKIIFAYCKSFLKLKKHRLTETDKLVNIIVRLYLEANESNKYYLTQKCLNTLDNIYSKHIVNYDLSSLQDS